MKNLLLLTLSLISFQLMSQCNLNANWTYSISGANITFTNTSTNEPTIPGYSWTYNGQSSSLENPTFTLANINATACLTVYNADSTGNVCSDTLCMLIPNTDSTASINSNQPKSILTIFPNPAKNEINIEVYTSKQSINIEIYDIRGKLIRQEYINNGIANYDISELEKGVYFIKIPSEEHTSKFIKY